MHSCSTISTFEIFKADADEFLEVDTEISSSIPFFMRIVAFPNVCAVEVDADEQAPGREYLIPLNFAGG